MRTVDVEDVAGLIVPSWLLLRLPCDQAAGEGRNGGHGGRRGGGTEAEALQEDT